MWCKCQDSSVHNLGSILIEYSSEGVTPSCTSYQDIDKGGIHVIRSRIKESTKGSDDQRTERRALGRAMTSHHTRALSQHSLAHFRIGLSILNSSAKRRPRPLECGVGRWVLCGFFKVDPQKDVQCIDPSRPLRFPTRRLGP